MTHENTEQKLQEQLRMLGEDFDECEVDFFPNGEDSFFRVKLLHGLTFDRLRQISNFFLTDDIDIGSDGARGSCDTCDYGSETWLWLDIFNSPRMPPR